MNISFVGLLLLFVVAVAVVASSANFVSAKQQNDHYLLRRPGFKAPSLPTYSLPCIIKYNSRIVEEGVQSTVTHIANADGTKFVSQTNTVSGTYTMLIRNDVLGYYDYYEINGQQVCYAVTLKQPMQISPLSLAGLQFDGVTLMNGMQVNVWRINKEVFYITAYTNAVTGAFLGVDNAEQMAVDETVFEFQQGANYQPDDSVFDIPAACQNAPPPVAEMDEKQHEEIKNRIYFHRIKNAIQQRNVKSLFTNSINTMKHFTHAAASKIAKMKSNGAVHLPSIAREIANPEHLLPANHFGSSFSSPKYQMKIDNSNYLSAVRNQGVECGCCWAMSSTAVAELYLNRANGRNADNGNGINRIGRGFSLSVQSVVDCAHGNLNGTALIEAKGCQGGYPLTAMLHIAQNGIPYDLNYPFDAANGRVCNLNLFSQSELFFPFRSAFVVTRRGTDDPNMVTQMEAALEKYGAFVAVINTPMDWLDMSQGVYDNAQCTPALNHAVAVIGTGVDESTGTAFWKVKNSFGRAWGVENGFFRMAKGKNMCGIEDFAFIAVPN